MAKIGETDAAWIAADRAAFCAERAGKPLAVAASMFCMAHVFLVLGRIDQAHHVATNMAHALEPKITPGAGPVVLSLYGAAHHVLAVVAARNNERGQAHEHLDTARKIAEQVGEDRDDYGTEFGPTNVAIHAVNVAVELGGAGQAIDLAQQVSPASLAPERRARYLLELAQAHAMRRQIGEALRALQEAERIAPEETPRPLRWPRCDPRPARAIRPAPAARATRPRRTVRDAALAEAGILALAASMSHNRGCEGGAACRRRPNLGLSRRVGCPDAYDVAGRIQRPPGGNRWPAARRPGGLVGFGPGVQRVPGDWAVLLVRVGGEPGTVHVLHG